uniref:Uncharacterized protein n=1 Tax=Tanacetum cinerariifolium TaxID=118510 RepID=A0A6L2JG49_TANCI|nr:hypothetical protein [Tanacetum cinerariifolium]
MEYLVKISKKAPIMELKRRHLTITILTPYILYPSRKIRRICAYTSQETTKEQRPIRRIIFRVPPYPFNYPTRWLIMEEILAKFIGEELSKVMINVLIPKNKVNEGTIRGGKMTSKATSSKEINETRINENEPPRFEQDVQEKPHDDGVKNKSSSIRERTTQPLVKPQ